MKVKLTNLDGSGSIGTNSLFNFSFAEDVTTLDLSNQNGGTGQVAVSTIAVEGDKIGNTHPDSKLLINNQMLLEHEDGGAVQFTVNQVSVANGVVSLGGKTIADRLNAEVFAEAHGGSGYTLLSAIQYYCSLTGISTQNENLVFEDGLDEDLDLIPVNYIAWTGNLWEHIKMLCSAVSASTTDNVCIEAYTLGDSLVFRRAKTRPATYNTRDLSNQSISINTFDAAREVEVFNYNTAYGVDAVVHDININNSGISYASQNSSIAEPLQVAAGETLVRRFTIDASLETINQPVAVDAILPLPYLSGDGQYAIAGNDGILIKADQWIGQGGSLTVSKTENPNEIEIRIVAPPVDSLPHVGGTTPEEVGYSPYRVGVEIADGQEYPALYITGSGVFYKKRSHILKTGASEVYTAQPAYYSIDNPFLTDLNAVYTKGAMAAQTICGPSISLSETVSDNLEFGATPGSMRTVGSANYRIESVQYSAEATNLTAVAMSSFDDFNAKWTDLTFADFTNTALDPDDFPNDTLKFNEFTVIPLMEPEPVA